MNRIVKAILFAIEIIVCYTVISGMILYECPFQKYLHIACPACGCTRAFREIFKLNIIEALQYNLLSVGVIALIIITDVCFIYDIILGKKKTEVLCDKLGKHVVPILIVLGINMIINNIKGI